MRLFPWCRVFPHGKRGERGRSARWISSFGSVYRRLYLNGCLSLPYRDLPNSYCTKDRDIKHLEFKPNHRCVFFRYYKITVRSASSSNQVIFISIKAIIRKIITKWTEMRCPGCCVFTLRNSETMI